MGFHAVSFGYTVQHGNIFDFLDLLFSEVKSVKTEDGLWEVTFHPYPDVLVNGKFVDEFIIAETETDTTIDKDVWMEANCIVEDLCDTEFAIRHSGTTFPIGQGHCCSFGLILSTVGDDCGGGGDQTFSHKDITEFLDLVQNLRKEGRIEGDEISMTGNCCS